jgi:hypothetical protein
VCNSKLRLQDALAIVVTFGVKSYYELQLHDALAIVGHTLMPLVLGAGMSGLIILIATLGMR